MCRLTKNFCTSLSYLLKKYCKTKNIMNQKFCKSSQYTKKNKEKKIVKIVILPGPRQNVIHDLEISSHIVL